jgi:hypothetical protein
LARANRMKRSNIEAVAEHARKSRQACAGIRT